MPLSEMPVTCARVDELLEALVDGEPSVPEEKRLRDHIAGCSHCTASYELASRIRRELPGLGVECPARVDRELLRRLGLDARPRWVQSFRLLPLAAALAALALLTLLFFYRPRPEEPSPTEIAAAEEQIRLAFSYVGEISQRSAMVAIEEALVGEVAYTVQDVARRLDRSLAPRDSDDRSARGGER